LEKDIKKLFDSFNGLNVLIIGDVMVDSYIWGKVDRISPEAPVPVVSVATRENRLGGAANVALNVKAMGANPILCSVIGKDAKGNEFTELLKNEGMTEEGILKTEGRITTTKFRIIGNKVQMLRVDEENDAELSAGDKESLINRIKSIIDQKQVHVIIFQDYDKGVISKEIITEIVSIANSKKIPVSVDPKKRNFGKYHNVNLFKPNLKELKEGLNQEVSINDISSIQRASNNLKDMLDAEMILITLSERGVFVEYDDNGEKSYQIIPSFVRSVSDVSGAGDTVISVASLCLAMKVNPEDVAFISNMAGGLVCEKVGVVPVNKQELLEEVILHRRS
jgi:rfaE bifunctional protein kinase chain/domain